MAFRKYKQSLHCVEGQTIILFEGTEVLRTPRLENLVGQETIISLFDLYNPIVNKLKVLLGSSIMQVCS